MNWTAKARIFSETRSKRRRNGFGSFLVLLLCVPTHAMAQGEPTAPTFRAESFRLAPAETGRALPGLIRLPMPVPAAAPLVISGTAAYGWFEAMDGLNASVHQLGGDVAIAYSPVPELSIAFDVSGRLDVFSRLDLAKEEASTKMQGVPRLAVRYARALNSQIYLGAQIDLEALGENAPSVELLRPSFLLMLGAAPTEQLWLGGSVGFTLDNSSQLFEEPGNLSFANRLTIGASEWSAIIWGVGASYRLAGPRTELLAEVGGDVLVGQESPSFLESPWRLSLGARQPVGEHLSVMAALDVSLSARPDTEKYLDSDYLIPLLPRFGGMITFTYRPWLKKPAPQAVPSPASVVVKPEPPPEPLVETPPASVLTGSVVDEGGMALADVEVTMSREGEEPVVERTLADGSFEFKEVPDAESVEIVVATPGYDDIKIQIEPGEQRTREVVLYRSLPAGQVRGAVLDLNGIPIVAKITISPGDQLIEVGPDGSFELELTPGRYTVTFEHEGFTGQKRIIVVEDRGVVILNIALN